MNKIISNILVLIIFLTAGGGFYLWQKNKTSADIIIENKQITQKAVEKIKTDKVKIVPVIAGSTYGSLMATSGVEYSLAMDIYNAAKEVYDLVKIREGRNIELVYDKDTDKLKELRYKTNSEEELIVVKDCLVATNTATTSIVSNKRAHVCMWRAQLQEIPYEVKIKVVGATVESSMYQAAIDNNIDIRAIIELANAFQWTIDFAMDPRKGDTFKFVYEERYLDGKYIMPGKVLAGWYNNAGEKYEIYYFAESDDNKGYFDQDGNSVQKMFLKAPVAFKYISSGYTTGARYVSAFKQFTRSHRAIDYAAALGTPVRAVGNGTVVFRGWHGPYGNFISIRHNGTYTTNYAHLSKFAVSYGQKVKQGEIIGNVGSTGYSTGPHLHFEMVKNGVKINPLKEVLPPGKPIKEENKARFQKKVEKYKRLLQ